MRPARSAVIWVALAAAVFVPLIAAGVSPLLAWRDPVYIAAGFAGVVALALMLVQPLLAAGLLPGLPQPRGRRLHRWVGAGLVATIVVHVAGLWLTSPPDVVDALLFTSPTPFSAWGVIAMWAVFAAALLAASRKRLPLRTWRLGHTLLVSGAVLGSVVHALLIEGTMEFFSKAALCALVLLATARAVTGLRPWAGRKRRNAPDQRPQS